jgi:enamine deaminase RidA (YjgF/YER057c/UK114 family)
VKPIEEQRRLRPQPTRRTKGLNANPAPANPVPPSHDSDQYYDPSPSLKPMSAEARLAELKLDLPPAPKPVAVYKSLVIVDRLAYVSGHGPLKPDKSLIVGRVGAELSLEEGQAAARQVGLAILATLRSELGSLDRVKRVIKTLGMVNSAPNFLDHPKVINGCSELFAEIWGENGIGARSAVGLGPLPGNIAVEIEVIFELA